MPLILSHFVLDSVQGEHYSVDRLREHRLDDATAHEDDISENDSRDKELNNNGHKLPGIDNEEKAKSTCDASLTNGSVLLDQESRGVKRSSEFDKFHSGDKNCPTIPLDSDNEVPLAENISSHKEEARTESQIISSSDSDSDDSDSVAGVKARCGFVFFVNGLFLK